MRETPERDGAEARVDAAVEVERLQCGAFVFGGERYVIVRTPDDTRQMSAAEQAQQVRIEGACVGVLWHGGEMHAISRAPVLLRSSGQGSRVVTKLTKRERQIVQLVAAGLPNKRIGIHLQISEATVGTHMRRVFAKLSVDNRAAMVHQCAPILESDPSR